MGKRSVYVPGFVIEEHEQGADIKLLLNDAKHLPVQWYPLDGVFPLVGSRLSSDRSSLNVPSLHSNKQSRPAAAVRSFPDCGAQRHDDPGSDNMLTQGRVTE